jgi:LysR family transcriptional regulator, regulator for bpeEF and oprC
MESLHGILVFLRVVDSGSLSSAARSLGVSTSAVSAALARLEARLSTRLVNRTTRRLSVTDEGAEFYERCKKIVSDLNTAELTVGRAGRVPSGSLRVGVPSALGSKWIAPRLGEFTDAFPAVSLEVICTDFVPYTIGEGVDVAVQIGELHDSSLAVRRLACSEYIVCAAPRYLAAHGRPKTPCDLKDHRCLTYRRPRNGRIWDWRFRINGAVQTVAVQGVVTMNSHEALASAAASGLGIVQVADYYGHAFIKTGELIEILEEYRTDGHVISAVFPNQQPFPPKIRAFVDFLARQFDRPPWSARTLASGPAATARRDPTMPLSEVKRGRYQPTVRRARSGRGRTPSARD